MPGQGAPLGLGASPGSCSTRAQKLLACTLLWWRPWAGGAWPEQQLIESLGGGSAGRQQLAALGSTELPARVAAAAGRLVLPAPGNLWTSVSCAAAKEHFFQLCGEVTLQSACRAPAVLFVSSNKWSLSFSTPAAGAVFEAKG